MMGDNNTDEKCYSNAMNPKDMTINIDKLKVIPESEIEYLDNKVQNSRFESEANRLSVKNERNEEIRFSSELQNNAIAKQVEEEMDKSKSREQDEFKQNVF